MEEAFPALWLSLRIASLAIVLAALLAIPLAYLTARREFFGRSVLDAVLMLPIVLPPTVVGYLLLMLGSKSGWPGKWIFETFNYSILFRFEAAVCAAAVVSFPLIYVPARSAFASIDRELEEIAYLMGASRASIFFHIALPMALHGIAGGLLLGFARAMGEFGATLMVYSFGPNKTTLPLLIWKYNERVGGLLDALPAVLMLAGVSMLVMFIHNRSRLGKID